MTVCTPPPPKSIVGTFTAGPQTVGGSPQDDATCGATAISGFTVCGKWWAYLCPSDLDLNGTVPANVFVGINVHPPAAELDLSATPPSVRIGQIVAPPTAALDLYGDGPALKINSFLAAVAAELDLIAGPSSIRFAGQVWLWPSDCIEDDLAPAVCTELDLALAVSTEITLQPAGCR